MRHGVRLVVGLSVCVGIAGAALFLLVDDLVPEPKTADDLGDPLDSEVEGLPVPAQADLLDGESGTLEPGEGLVSGRVYDFPGGFSRGDVEQWYEDREIAGQPWRDQWTWCPPAEPAGDDVEYVWVLPSLDAILSLAVGTDDRNDSPAVGEVVVRMEIRQLSSLPPEEQPAC